MIDEAVNAHKLEELTGGWDRYRFSHALVQETLPEELPTRNKLRLHARIGTALESLHRAHTQAHSGELAYRFGEAEPILGAGKLVHYSLLAGERALDGFAFEEALAFSRDAGYRLELAWTCCDYADTLLHPLTGSGGTDVGDRSMAMSLLDESLAISTELGMRPLMERVLSRRDILRA